jgi:tRNA pseudouridine13 synthase
MTSNSRGESTVPLDAVLKHTPFDFQVRENLVVSFAEPADAEYRYLLLRKCGYTTMEAVRMVAAEFDVTTREVTYAGLKDEDGITEQLVAMPIATLREAPAATGLRIADTGERWMVLSHYGFGTVPLQIGGLEGNGFRIVVRNLDNETAERLASRPKVVLLFLNYYDTQRFGVPGGPKRTHLVGRAILSGEWNVALQELAGLKAPESAGAVAWTGSPRAFFDQLDPRTTSFYLSAHASSLWNAELAELVTKAAGDEAVDVSVDGITYRYPTGSRAPGSLLVDAPSLPYDKYSYVDGVPTPVQSTRATVVQTTVAVEGCASDPHHPGRSAVTVRFFLPSGCYATAVVRQWLSLTD